LYRCLCLQVGSLALSGSESHGGCGAYYFSCLILAEHWPAHDCHIDTQNYLRRFYESFGFVVNGNEYHEDGIPPLPIRRRANVPPTSEPGRLYLEEAL
jgi:ElaA protein